MKNNTVGQEHRVYCRQCGPQFISTDNYRRQLGNPDAFWKCPVCGEDANFDDDYEWAQQGYEDGPDEEEPKTRNNTIDQEHRVNCTSCGPVFMSTGEYYRQMRMPDAAWECPQCGGIAHFDDQYEAMQMSEDVKPVNKDIDFLCLYCKHNPGCENIGHAVNTEGCVEGLDLAGLIEDCSEEQSDDLDSPELSLEQEDFMEPDPETGYIALLVDDSPEVESDSVPFPYPDDYLHYNGEN